MADIDRCESNRDEAFAVNVGVTEALVALCRETGARMVYVSTDTVFDGKKGRYRETDPPGPINYYAETKARAESSVSKTLSEAVIARLSLVVGFPVIGAGNSLLAKIVPEFEVGRQVGAPADEYRTPIDVITAGRALLELAGGSVAGCVHLAGNDRVSRFELLRRVAARMGYPTELVVARAAGNAPGRAPRPQDVSLDNARARAVLATPMVGIERGLDLILNARKGVFP
jgi:dTDP-4-dehydrorhamnose reductase